MIDTALKNQAQNNKEPKVIPKKRLTLNSGFIKQEDLFIKISTTPSKGSLYTPPISTDRATESTLHRKNTGMEEYPFGRDVQTEKKKNYGDL